jgi:hypothetical protein
MSILLIPAISILILIICPILIEVKLSISGAKAGIKNQNLIKILIAYSSVVR